MKKSELRKLIKETIIELNEQEQYFDLYITHADWVQYYLPAFGNLGPYYWSLQNPGITYDPSYSYDKCCYRFEITGKAYYNHFPQFGGYPHYFNANDCEVNLIPHPNIPGPTACMSLFDAAQFKPLDGIKVVEPKGPKPKPKPNSNAQFKPLDGIKVVEPRGPKPNSNAQFKPFNGIKDVEPKGNDGPNPDDFGGGMGHPSGLGREKRPNFKRKRPNFRRR